MSPGGRSPQRAISSPRCACCRRACRASCASCARGVRRNIGRFASTPAATPPLVVTYGPPRRMLAAATCRSLAPHQVRGGCSGPRCGMNELRLGEQACLPLVQGGMGVGVSAHRLAGSVAREGCVGTVSSVDLRRLHPDLMRATGKSRDKAAIEQANLQALAREIGAARELAGGRGAIAVNVMRAVSQYADYVRTAC